MIFHPYILFTVFLLGIFLSLLYLTLNQIPWFSLFYLYIKVKEDLFNNDLFLKIFQFSFLVFFIEFEKYFINQSLNFFL